MTDAWSVIAPQALAAQMRSAVEDLSRAIPSFGQGDDERPDGFAKVSDQRENCSGELARGAAGREVFQWYASLAQRVAPDELHRSRALDGLGHLMAEEALPPGLFLGVSGLMWSYCHIHQGSRGPTVARTGALNLAFDATMGQAVRDWQSGLVDLIAGLCGIGVYFLERLPTSEAVAGLGAIVERLKQLAVRTDRGAWWATPPEWVPEDLRPEYPEGWCDIGMAHGLGGVIGLLAHIKEGLPEYQGGDELLEESIDFALAVSRDHGGGSDLPKGFRLEGGRLGAPRILVSHAAWCHGSLGLAGAISKAATVTGNKKWLQASIAMARAHADHLSQPEPTTRDTALCHGLAGNAHLLNRLFQRSGDERVRDGALRCYERLLHHRSRRHPDSVAGFRVLMPANENRVAWTPSFAFLSGASGIGLALLAGSDSTPPHWDRVLLI